MKKSKRHLVLVLALVGTAVMAGPSGATVPYWNGDAATAVQVAANTVGGYGVLGLGRRTSGELTIAASASGASMYLVSFGGPAGSDNASHPTIPVSSVCISAAGSSSAVPICSEGGGGWTTIGADSQNYFAVPSSAVEEMLRAKLTLDALLVKHPELKAAANDLLRSLAPIGMVCAGW